MKILFFFIFFASLIGGLSNVITTALWTNDGDNSVRSTCTGELHSQFLNESLSIGGKELALFADHLNGASDNVRHWIDLQIYRLSLAILFSAWF
jgi:hypothetical protein